MLRSRGCRYDPAAVAGAWGQLLSGSDVLAGESTYLYDLADVGRQVPFQLCPAELERHSSLQGICEITAVPCA